MPNVNPDLLKLKNNYFFNEIDKKVKLKNLKNPLNLGIGDITQPLASSIIEALKKASLEMGSKKTLKGYGPSDGYLFLKEKIKENDYLNLDIDIDEIFISNGIKYSASNIGDLFSKKSLVGIANPSYPVYVDANVIGGRKQNILYLPLKEENNFEPICPQSALDIIYLCSPNNPTGIAQSRQSLEMWVDYAKKHQSVIIFDGAYGSFITSDNIPRSIYEIEGAKDVAIEMRSFSKQAGFTSLRCSYLVIPKKLKSKDNFLINSLWKKYIDVRLGGVSYPIQKAAEAIFSKTGKVEIQKTIDIYQQNTKILLNGLKKLDYKVYGGIDSPYVWCKNPNNLTSWQFFDKLLDKSIISIPGSGFGTLGEGYIRFSGFAKKEIILEALNNLKAL
ncbi:MAG: LL-diaminopimelate aminotransferase [Candidatus Anoxychlamydiales bacterium]|nr:LL-diaminopimelate aminotransferase [Candidatus Anoxychlamydiales bacterium]NGX36673.1 LL-diaminopimelate aminotransferase [Candidatus Anoxychlamydiales bacterium]